MPDKISSAQDFARSGQSQPTTWIVDTDAGISMIWDSSEFKPGSLIPFTGGSAQVGFGDLCPATHKGVLHDIHVRIHGTGKATALPTITEAWLIPALVFNILSTSALKDVNVGMHNCAPGKLANYLCINDTNELIKLRKFKRIYVLKTIQSAPCLKADVLERKLNHSIVLRKREHHDIYLWFVFNRHMPVESLVTVVASDPGLELISTGPHLGDHLPSELHQCYVEPEDFGGVIENYDEHAPRLDDVRQGLAICENMGAVPSHVLSDPGNPQETFDYINYHGLGESVHGQEYVSSLFSKFTCCLDAECENICCVSHICGVHKGGINKTSPFYLAKRNMRLQHARHAHRNEALLYDASRRGRIKGLELRSPASCNCRVCDLCKHKRVTFKVIKKHENQIAYEDGLETCSIDYIGPMRTKSKLGNTGAHVAMHLGCRT